MAPLWLALLASSFVFVAGGLTLAALGLWAKPVRGWALVLAATGAGSAAASAGSGGRGGAWRPRQGVCAGLWPALRGYGAGGSADARLDALQPALSCCGVDGAGYWRSSRWAGEPPPPSRANDSLPASCCCPAPAAPYCAPAARRGCSVRALNFVLDNTGFLAAAALGLAAAQVVGVVPACLLDPS